MLISDDLVDAIVRRRSGDDAVEVAGITLRFAESLVAAGVAAKEIREVGMTALVAADDQLRQIRHDVNRAIRPVDDLFRMAVGELQLAAGVAGVAAGDGIAARQGGRHVAVLDRSEEARRADGLKPPVPGMWRR